MMAAFNSNYMNDWFASLDYHGFWPKYAVHFYGGGRPGGPPKALLRELKVQTDHIRDRLEWGDYQWESESEDDTDEEVGLMRQFFGFEPDDDQFNPMILFGVIFNADGHEDLPVAELGEEQQPQAILADAGYDGEYEDIDSIPSDEEFEYSYDHEEEDEYVDDSISIEPID